MVLLGICVMIFFMLLRGPDSYWSLCHSTLSCKETCRAKSDPDITGIRVKNRQFLPLYLYIRLNIYEGSNCNIHTGLLRDGPSWVLQRQRQNQFYPYDIRSHVHCPHFLRCVIWDSCVIESSTCIRRLKLTRYIASSAVCGRAMACKVASPALDPWIAIYRIHRVLDLAQPGGTLFWQRLGM